MSEKGRERAPQPTICRKHGSVTPAEIPCPHCALDEARAEVEHWKDYSAIVDRAAQGETQRLMEERTCALERVEDLTQQLADCAETEQEVSDGYRALRSRLDTLVGELEEEARAEPGPVAETELGSVARRNAKREFASRLRSILNGTDNAAQSVPNTHATKCAPEVPENATSASPNTSERISDE